MQFEVDAFFYHITQGFTISCNSSFVRYFCKIVSFKLDSVEFVVAAKILNLFAALFLAHYFIPILVASKFFEKIFFSETLAIFFFCTKTFRDGKVRHNRRVINVVYLYLVTNLTRILYSFGNVIEYLIHFPLRFKPFLFGVHHSFRIVQVSSGRKAYQPIVRLCVLFFYKVNIVSTYKFYIVFTSYINKNLICSLL